MRHLDLTNIKFGNLTAMKINGKRGKQILWECICDCGNIRNISTGDLRTGHIKSCGCSRNKPYRSFIKDGKRLCTKCNQYKPLTAYCKVNATKYQGICRECTNEKVKHRIQVNNKLKEYRNGYHREYMKTWRVNPIRKICHRVSEGIRRSLKSHKNYITWSQFVDFSIEELREHLESKFTVGMGWYNIAEWHIDHIIPINAFNIKKSDDIDFKRCWELSNLQPLWANENRIKRCKLKKPFQPSLSLSAR